MIEDDIKDVPSSIDDVIRACREGLREQKWSPEVIAFRRTGGRVSSAGPGGEIDVEFKVRSSSNDWARTILNQFRRLKRVRSIKIGMAEELADEVVRSVSDAFAIVELDLRRSELTDAGLQHVVTFLHLESLDVSATPITDEGLVRCADLPNLSTLLVSATSISKRGVLALAALPRLQHLDLSITDVADDVCDCLSRCDRLHSVNLADTLLSDRAIEPLVEIPSLCRIDLTGSLFSRAGIERFRALRPDVEVEWSPTLNLVGYWPDNMAHGRSFIPPRILVDSCWERALRPQIVRYLKHAQVLRAFRGKSTCRFGCGENGFCEMTDGKWVWPEGLAHYVEMHGVRLPNEFVDQMQQVSFEPPGEKEFAEQMEHNSVKGPPGVDGKVTLEVRTSTAFWRSWCRQQCQSDVTV